MKITPVRFNGIEIDKHQIRQLFVISAGCVGCSDTILRLVYDVNGETYNLDRSFETDEDAEERLEEIRKKLDFISISHREIYNPDHFIDIKHRVNKDGNYCLKIFMRHEKKYEVFSSAEEALEFYSSLPDNFTNQPKPGR